VSDLLLVIREVDKVIYLQEEIVFNFASSKARCYVILPSNPILAGNTPAYLGSNAFRAATGRTTKASVATSSRNLTIWDSRRASYSLNIV
jgi:hypothetical protein